MRMLSKPSKELARRILTDVAFEDRIEGFRLRERTGIIPATLYSYSEVVGFLSDPFPRIDLPELASWVHGIMKDTELAGKIEDISSSAGSDLEKTKHIGNIMGFRLDQCKKIV
jgi:hypothetical protein